MGQTVATNKKAFRDYFFSDKWECGIELVGAEVKSIRAGHVNFKDAFARVDKGQVFLHNLHIEPYAQASYNNVESDRMRRLLMHKKEIKKMESKAAQGSLTLVPTKIYFNSRGFLKVELALGRGKKSFDKRETIKKRDIERSLGRMVRGKR